PFPRRETLDDIELVASIADAALLFVPFPRSRAIRSANPSPRSRRIHEVHRLPQPTRDQQSTHVAEDQLGGLRRLSYRETRPVRLRTCGGESGGLRCMPLAAWDRQPAVIAAA